MKDDILLNHLYYVKHNYDSIENLYKKAKALQSDIKKDFVKEWLSKQQNKQMNDDKVEKKEFLPIYSDMPYAFQIDLTFFPRYKKQNRNYYVLFTAININTRYAYAYYGKDKEMNTILDMLKEMETKTVINSITCDEGSEFKNKEFQKFCNDNEIIIYFVKNDGHKLGIINRFHRTLKDKLTKYFSAHDTVNWIDVIDDIIHNYNHTVNRGIGIEPFKMNSFLENQLVQKKKEKTTEMLLTRNEINVGDYCRVKLKKDSFSDKLQSKWSSDIYKIIKVKNNKVEIEDKNSKVFIAKISDIKIINKNVENNIELKERVKANKESKIDRKLKKVDVKEDDIVEGKRVRKKTVKLDL